MGEEEARTEVSDVVANGTEDGDVGANGQESLEKVEKDGITNEDQIDVKPIVEDTNGEGKVDSKEDVDDEKVDEDKMDEDKKEDEKENEPKEKEGQEEGETEAIVEEKGSVEDKQEEGKNEAIVEEKGSVEGEQEEAKNEAIVEEKGSVEGKQEQAKNKAIVEEKGSVEGKQEEVKNEAIVEQKGSVEGKQEEDKKDEKVDVSEEKMDGVEESKEEIEEVKEKKEEEKSSKKRKRGKSELEKSKDKEEEKEHEPKTPTVTNRPVRERKSVERLVAVIEKDAFKEFQVEKGPGTRLKDIPNVAFKLSRKKSEDTLKLLHTIIFGRRGKAGEVKNNISRFSGFVWRDNEEKQKLKVKEKFDKCVKEKLWDICDVLDIPISKSTAKKDDIVAKLLDFLVAPHATTTELLAEKEQSSKGKKRVREDSAPRSWGSSTKRSVKSRKKSSDYKKEVNKSASDTGSGSEEGKLNNAEQAENGIPERTDDEKSEHSESKEKDDASEESEEDTAKAKKGSKKNSSRKDSAGKGKTKEITTPKKSASKAKGTPKKSSSKGAKVISDDADTIPKVFSRKKKNNGEDEAKAPTPKRSASGKRSVKGKEKPKDDKTKPTDDELRNAVSELLKEVDFNTVTFKDIMKKLSKKFNMDLTSRKAAVKLMLQDELTKLADEAEVEDGEEDEGEGNEDADKENAKPAELEVAA